MSQQIQLDYEITLECTCGNELSAEWDRSQDAFRIEPCENCLGRREEEARSDAHQDGYNEGYAEGYNQGEEDGYYNAIGSSEVRQ